MEQGAHREGPRMQLDQPRRRARRNRMCAATPNAMALVHLVKVCDQRIDGRVEGELPAASARIVTQLGKPVPIAQVGGEAAIVPRLKIIAAPCSRSNS